MSSVLQRAAGSHLKILHAELNAIGAYGHSRRRIVEDWIALMFWAFQRNDPKYLEVLARYEHGGKKRGAAEHFANAMAALMEHMRQTNEETLGAIYMEFCANEHMGQFFTPMPLCSMMAKMTLQDGVPEGRNFSVSEPCAGSGRMIVALAQELLSEQADRCHFFAQDLDLVCCMMTALNMMFFNLQGMVVWGNALNIGDVRGAWMTQRSHLWGGSIASYPKEDAATQIVALWENTAKAALTPFPASSPQKDSSLPADAMMPPRTQKPVQLRLF